MTAEPLTTAIEAGGTATPASARAIRSFVRGRRRRPWFDLYAIGFGVVMAAIYLSDLLSAPLSRLGAAAAHPARQASSQAVAGAALVIGSAAGLLMLVQAFGPIVLSPADSSWLLFSPLRRRPLLRRPAAAVTALSALAGAVGGVLALAMAGPFLPRGPGGLPASWVALSAVIGAGLFLSVVFTAVLAQPRERWRARLRWYCAAVAAIALLGALAGERWAALARAITGGFARTSTSSLSVIAVAAVGLAAVIGVLAWHSLRHFPASVLRTDSARASRALTAAAFLNVPLLTWIAEDNHWRGRRLPSRPWQWRSPAMVLAWADWRRLGRRPALLAVVAASTILPALAGAALTGKAHGVSIAAVLLFGAIAAGLPGTTGTRRDTNDRTLRRLLGVTASAALAARAVLPALLTAAWLAVALALLVATGVLHGWLWPLLGLFAGPGVTAAALRMARSSPINPVGQGAPDLAMGSPPPWVISRAMSLVAGVVGAFPALRAVMSGHVTTGTITGQVAVSAIVLGIYLTVAGSMSA